MRGLELDLGAGEGQRLNLKWSGFYPGYCGGSALVALLELGARLVMSCTLSVELELWWTIQGASA